MQKVLAKLTGRDTVQLVGLQQEQAQLEELLAGSILYGEGNSCMILGPRSTGKTTLIQTTLGRLEDKYPDQFITVDLSGFVQLDDKLALREISRQLNAYTEGDFDSGGALRHTLFQILDAFRESSSTHKTVIFVLEELDRFARHPRQTLLYNLLELAQTGGIAVVGVSCRINAREMLEKRVLSRFSQRVYQINRAPSLEDFWHIAKTNLCLEPPESRNEEQWNESIEAMFQDDNSKLFRLVEHIYYTSKDIRELNNAMIKPVALADPFIDPNNIDLEPLSHTALFVEGLAELELALLICSSRVEQKTETLNFNLAYDEYVTQAKAVNMERKAATSTFHGIRMGRYRIWSKEAALSAWERLEAMQLVVPVFGMFKSDISLLEIGRIIGSGHMLYPWTRV